MDIDTPNMKLASDEELVTLYKTGEEKAFEELYRRFAPRLKRLIYFYIYNSEDVGDVFHEVFLRVVRHIDSFNLEKSFSSWIYQIAVNCCRNYHNRSKRNNELIDKQKFKLTEDPREEHGPEDKFLSDFDMTEFNSAVASLKEKFRDVFILRYDQKLMYSEIARVLDCSERTAKWRMEKAIESISKRLKDKGVI